MSQFSHLSSEDNDSDTCLMGLWHWIIVVSIEHRAGLREHQLQSMMTQKSGWNIKLLKSGLSSLMVSNTWNWDFLSFSFPPR